MNPYSVGPREDARFRKSSYSDDQQACVEVAGLPDGGRWVRDSKDRARPALYFTPVEWDAFVRAVKDGEFD